MQTEGIDTEAELDVFIDGDGGPHVNTAVAPNNQQDSTRSLTLLESRNSDLKNETPRGFINRLGKGCSSTIIHASDRSRSIVYHLNPNLPLLDAVQDLCSTKPNPGNMP